MSDPSHATGTEEPTPRRLDEARRAGQVPISGALIGWTTLAILFLVLLLLAGTAVGQLVVYLRAALARAASGGALAPALFDGGRQALALLVLPLGLALLVTAIVGLVQTGGLVSALPLRLGRARPTLRAFFRAGVLAEVGKGLLGATVLAALVALAVRPVLRALISLTGASAGRVLATVGLLSATLGWRLISAGMALGVVDLAWRRWRYRRAMRMTRVEIERERKQHEGDPRQRTERQRLHRDLLESSDLGDVGRASFVVAGARTLVALRLDGDRAPVVVARGAGLLAGRLADVARHAGVPNFLDPPLAEALWAVPVGAHIPEALYAPIAEIVKVILEHPSPSMEASS